ncbi:hypothetical protein ACFQ8E_16005 [Isoptericola sp. NPDC056573]|uniref:hypothetical protein n=1 Tax=unclassified Isoptericola TaxID=2623355 RepID=UPI00367E5B2F
MAEIAWLVTGERSGLTFLTSPDGDPAAIREALGRLDGVSAVMTAPPQPGWYRAVSRLGYVWYVLVAVLAFAVLTVASDLTVTRTLLYSVLLAAVLGPITGGVLASVARRQARVEGADDAARDAAIAERSLVRIPQQGTVEAVRTIVAADAAQEPRVHDLAWRTSAAYDVDTDPEASTAADELFDLQDRISPEPS